MASPYRDANEKFVELRSLAHFHSFRYLRGTGEYSVNDSCAKCHSSCETCSDGSSHTCLSCPFRKLLQNNSCVAECSSGFFTDQSGCSPCSHTCEQCSSRFNCSKCRTPLLLQSGECRTTCANGYVTILFFTP